MVKITILFVIAVVFLLISLIIKKAHQNEILQIENCKQTYATIKQTIYSDTGEAMYEVSFEDKGRTIIAQTDYYSSETKSLNPGDKVKIGYFFIRENIAHAVIFDDRVIPVSDSDLSFCKFNTVIGILLLLVCVVMFVKLIFMQ